MLQGKEPGRAPRRRRAEAGAGGLEGPGVRALIAAFGDAGHAFPAIALARELAGRGHEITVESGERWREPVEELGIGFRPAEGYTVFPPPPPDSGASAAEAALALAPLFEELEPEVVVSDILTRAPALAAELHGCPLATLVPHLYPVNEPGMPLFSLGVMPPRGAAGRALWRGARPLLESGLRRGRSELNESRARLGLPPLSRLHGGLSEELVLVGSFPELEYPRRWPAHVRVCGPLGFELPHPDVELPEGEGPLVLVASSTAHDPECGLIRDAFAALAGAPVRVLATSNGHFPRRPIEAPPNGRLVGWLSYSQAMPAADLVVCHGGHGTLCRALQAGKPLLVSPSIGDMAENGARVQWAGAGLMLPSRLRSPRTLRWCAEELLGAPSYAQRARAIGASPAAAAGPARAADAVEERVAG
jgi:UDP:flavonoid glycosyltransferase YjiC (YdhE family)